MNDGKVVYIGLDEWAHLAAEVLVTTPASIRRVADSGLADSALHPLPLASVTSRSIPSSSPKRRCWGGILPETIRCPTATAHRLYRHDRVPAPKRRDLAHPDTADAVATMLAVAAGEMSVEQLTAWIARHIDT